jgi:ribosome-binding protein aMBF1 (putative translation factor)
MVEQQLEAAAENVKRAIKTKLIERGISQTQLAKLIHEGVQQTNRAISGDTTPKSKTIRKKIYLILGME